MAFNDIYRLRIYGRLHGAQLVNVLHFVQEEVSPSYGAQQLADDFLANIGNHLRNRASNQTQFELIEVQSLVPFSGGPVTASWPANSFGGTFTPCQSATLAEVITIYTSRAGRRGRGRIYLAGAATSTGEIQNGVWQAAQTGRTQGLATALATRYMVVPVVGKYALGVWSKAIAGPTPPWPTDAFARATALTVRTIVRTQRRRQVGVGR